MTKEHILSQVNEAQIYKKFCDKYTVKSNISSPFSEDKTASFKFYENNSFKCFSSGKQGDCFQFVADLNNLNCKTEFHKVLALICDAFSIENEKSSQKKASKPLTNKPAKSLVKDPKKAFTYTSKPFEKIHLDYFNQANWNVSEAVLNNYEVSALDKFEYWNSVKNEITKIKLFKNIIGFAYKVNKSVEIYVPKQEKAKKFFLNKLSNSDIFGLEQLPEFSDYLIIAAGKKDCLILNANGFPSVSFRSENHHITPKQIDILKSRASSIFVCYDNDISGMNASITLAAQFDLLELALPGEFNDVACFFEKKAKGDFKTLVENALIFSSKSLPIEEAAPEVESGNTIFHIIEDYLSENYFFRFNKIMLDIEFKKKQQGAKWSVCNENSLFVELQKKGIKASIGYLMAILRSDYVQEYDPINAYFKQLQPWDGKTDHIAELVSYIKTPSPVEFAYHLKKWMARSVKCMLIDGYFNKQAFIITDKGSGQDMGKSHLTRWLVPKELTSTRSFEDNKKDNLTKIATNAFIILDELDELGKRDLSILKSLFSTDEIRVRLPYDKRDSTVQRTANFLGSTNEAHFLVDTTGSVRWLVFQVNSINWDYSKKMEVDHLWAQAYALAKDVNFEERFTKEDARLNELRNESYQVRSPEAEIISILYDLPNSANSAQVIFLTATEILIFLKANSGLNNLTVGPVGKALRSLRFPRVKKGVYGYNVVPTGKILGMNKDEY